MELVTIIVPAHNYGNYISQTLDSILSQSYIFWECIIVDDGSTDNTKQVVEKYTTQDARFQYHYQSCQGVSMARNCGMKHAKGEYIQFLDADDLLLATKIARHVDYLQKNNTVDIVYSESKYFKDEEKDTLSYSFDMQNIQWMPKLDGKPGASLFSLAKSNIMPIQAPLSRASLLSRVGYFNPEMRYCEDWDYWFRCVMTGGEIRFLDEPEAMSLVRVHQVSASQNKEAMAIGWERMMQNIFSFIRTNPNNVDKLILNDIKRTRSLDLVKNKRYKEAFSLYKETIGRPTSGLVTYKDVVYWLRYSMQNH